jgi:tetratricopeptide (TPR) repeat protein
MRPHLTAVAVAGLLLAVPAVGRAGLYYSGEEVAELPSQWRGFLIDQRVLRNIAVKLTGANPVNPARKLYEAEAAKLGKAAKGGKLSPDESADLGAIYMRLGEVDKALEVLQPAQRAHPEHFRLNANLGTAWQLNGDLDQAAAYLQQAVRLSPDKTKKAEELHLKLVRQRARPPRDVEKLDDLFGVRYVGPGGKYAAGRLDAEQRKALPDDAAALLQQLALWLPADGRLLWQMGELAAVNGDTAAGAAMLDGCVTEFGMRSLELREHRQALRNAADALASPTDPNARPAHDGASFPLKPRSSRPLVHKIDMAELPPIDPKGVNVLPWTVVTETVVGRKFHPSFPKYLKELDGRQVQLTGTMQPLGEEQESGAFLLIEYPVGCWFCEMPEVTAIVLVELTPGKTREVTRGRLRITGRLTLNGTDPENFLYIIKNAKAVETDE